MKKPLLQSVALSVIVLLGCGGSSVDGRGSLSRLTSAAPSEHVTDAVRGLNDLAFSLHRRVATPSRDFASAPISVSMALAMTSGGAAGATLEGFNQALRVQRAKTEFHGALNTLDLELASRGKGANGFDGKPFALRLTNQLFTHTGLPLEQAWLDLLVQHYGASVERLDFVSQTEDSRRAINAFVAERTADLVPELVPAGSITHDTRFVLANAVYFNAAWAQKFDARLTQRAPFTTSSGEAVEVPMMATSRVGAGVATVDSVVAVELPYETGELSLLLLMPAQGRLAALEQSLSAATLEAFVSALQWDSVQLSMPKFKVRSATNLNEALKAEGLELAFDRHRADFTALSPKAKDELLHLTDVAHQAVITVSEGGTEAAAAAAVAGGVLTSFPRVIAVDRPFVFLVRDRKTGVVLFLGHVVDPR